MNDKLYREIWQLRYYGLGKEQIMLELNLSEHDWIVYLVECHWRSEKAKDNRIKQLRNKYINTNYEYLILEDKVNNFKRKKGAPYPKTDFFAMDIVNKFGPKSSLLFERNSFRLF